MTNQEINERVANLCGWTFESRETADGYKYRVWFAPGRIEPFEGRLNYAESLDACREFISRIDEKERDEFSVIVCQLERINPLFEYEFWWAVINVTPLELCEAFLRLKGQWE